MKSKEEILLHEVGNDGYGEFGAFYLQDSVYQAMDMYTDQQTESLRKENERLKSALHEIMTLKTDGSKYDYNKCWNIADKAINL